MVQFVQKMDADWRMLSDTDSILTKSPKNATGSRNILIFWPKTSMGGILSMHHFTSSSMIICSWLLGPWSCWSNVSIHTLPSDVRVWWEAPARRRKDTKSAANILAWFFHPEFIFKKDKSIDKVKYSVIQYPGRNWSKYFSRIMFFVHLEMSPYLNI